MEEKKFALLIDADNISSKYIKIIIEELSKYGTITYKRLYGFDQGKQQKLETRSFISFYQSRSAIQLHNRQEFNRFRDDYRCNGYSLFGQR